MSDRCAECGFELGGPNDWCPVCVPCHVPFEGAPLTPAKEDMLRALARYWQRDFIGGGAG
jgi:hypothetical protein